MAVSIFMPVAPSLESHSGLMDQVYRHQRHFYDFTRKYYLFGRDRLIARLDLKPNASLVEVGCGTARNLIAIARRYPDARLYGLDASAAMLETARAAVHRAGLDHRITLAAGLAEDLSPTQFGVESFENVLFSYSLSMIPDARRAAALAQPAIRAPVAGPGGCMVDFHDLTGLVLVNVMRAWLKLFHVTPRVEFLAALEGVTKNSGALTLLFGRYAFIFSSGKM